MRLSKDEVRCTWECDRKKDRRQFAVFAVIFVLLFLLCLSFRSVPVYYSDKFIPLIHLKCYANEIRLLFARLFDPVTYAKKGEMIAAVGADYYTDALAQLKIMAMAAVAGAGTAVAGAVFQTIYRNPMASPGMLGATAGVRLGNVLMITLYSTQALEMITRRYVFCYSLTAACVLVVIVLGKLAGDRKGNPSVMKMVMAGSIISQGMNVFIMYYMYELTDEDLVLFQELTMGTNIQYDALSLIIFFGAMAVSLIPMFILRYKFNGAALDYAEAATSGVNTGALRLTGQVCSVIMVTASMIHCGDTGMIGMMIPYSVRKYAGANTKKVIVFSALAGGALLMVCRLISSFVVIEGEKLPVGFIMNIFLTPFFMIMMGKQRRGFEQ